MEGALRDSGAMSTILEKGNGMEIEDGSEEAAVNGSLRYTRLNVEEDD